MSALLAHLDPWGSVSLYAFPAHLACARCDHECEHHRAKGEQPGRYECKSRACGASATVTEAQHAGKSVRVVQWVHA